MQLDDFTRRGWLQRWMLIDGHPRCPYDAIEPHRLTPAEAAAVLAANAEVRAAVAAGEALEAARRVRTGEQPPLDDPAHEGWQAAGETIAGASGETLALEAIRNGEDEDREPDVIDPDPFEDRFPTGPVPDVISDRQFIAALKAAGLVTHAEAMAFVQTGTIPAALTEAIGDLPDEDEQEAAELLVAGAYEFRRSSPLVAAFGSGLGWTPRQVDDLWRTASAL
ncbi:hypothetical protein [Phreatobacter sp.]|uniref:hypothetical protein n=1 Tax=Phreatobacter sp. TaxID=1966341 RepID=UPI003F6FC4BF